MTKAGRKDSAAVGLGWHPDDGKLSRIGAVLDDVRGSLYVQWPIDHISHHVQRSGENSSQSMDWK